MYKKQQNVLVAQKDPFCYNVCIVTNKELVMSKKHFESLAKYVRAIMDPHARLQAACAVASSCAEMNPRFDTQKFFEACGV